jgi:hypothetical protein
VAESKFSMWEVFARMADDDDPAFNCAPLSNVLRLQRDKHGVQITIGAPTQYMAKLANGECIGGLLMVDRKAYEATLRKMEQEARARG